MSVILHKLEVLIRLYKQRLERCEGLIAAAVEEITARCDQEIAGYQGATYKDVVTLSNSVKDSNKTTSLHDNMYNRRTDICASFYKGRNN